MNKRIVAISVLLLMMCAMAASVFADDRTMDYEYKVTVSYVKDGRMLSKDYIVWASSHSEAQEEAKKACAWEGLDVRSCGYPVATGKSRPR
jgi:hypothetical protein